MGKKNIFGRQNKNGKSTEKAGKKLHILKHPRRTSVLVLSFGI